MKAERKLAILKSRTNSHSNVTLSLAADSDSDNDDPPEDISKEEEGKRLLRHAAPFSRSPRYLSKRPSLLNSVFTSDEEIDYADVSIMSQARLPSLKFSEVSHFYTSPIYNDRLKGRTNIRRNAQSTTTKD